MKNNEILFAIKSEDVKIPSKNVENAGYDIYAYFDDESMTIEAHETKLIPTGLYSACNDDYYFQLLERGSTGSKGIAQRCGVIDSGYRGEWFVPLTNTTNKRLVISKDIEETLVLEDVILYPYKKAICQMVVLPVPKMEVKTISLEELKNIKSIRGEGCLGSSNK